MKKIVLVMVVITLSFVLGNCSKENNGRNGDISSSKEITVYNGLSGNRQDDYIQFLKDKYDIVLTSVDWDNQNQIGSPKGVLKVSSTGFKSIYPDRYNTLTPLNDFIKADSIINSIPDNMKKALMDSDGNIWGLLYSHRFDTVSRVYNTKLLEQLGADIPNDVEQLRELLIKVKESTDYPVIKITRNNCVEYFYDIFAAFGCPLFSNKYTIGWSEERNAFIDFGKSDEMLASLEYIKELNNYNIIEEGSSSIDVLNNEFDNNELFTLVKYNSQGVNDKYMTCALNNSQINIEIGIENSPFIYVLPLGTENPEVVLDNFFSSFYANEQVNKSGRYGMEGERYTYIDEDFVLIGDKQSSSWPMLSDYWINNSYLTIRSLDERANYSNWIDSNRDKYIEAFYNDVYHIVPVTKSLALERLGMTGPNEATLHNKFSEMFYNFLAEDQSSETFVAEYNNEMQKLGIGDYLDKLNGY